MMSLPSSAVSKKNKRFTALWSLAPIYKEETVVLAMPLPRAMQKLTTVVDGDWSIDGGTKYVRSMPYRDLHEYNGVVNGQTFQVVGPFGRSLLPMILHGTLYGQGQISYLQLTLETSLVKTLFSLSKTAMMVLAFFGLSAVVGWWMGVTWVQLGSTGLFLFFSGCMFGAFTYLNLVGLFHRQTQLLFQWLMSQLGASPSTRRYENHRG